MSVRRLSIRNLFRAWLPRRVQTAPQKRHALRIQFERLEDRLAPATISDVGTTSLNIVLGTNEALAIVSNGTSYTLSSNQNFSAASGADPANQSAAFGGIGTKILTLTSAGLAQYATISIVDAAAGDSVTFNDSGANAYSTNFNIGLSNASAGTITLNGNSTYGAFSVQAATTGNVLVGVGALLTSTSGNITLQGKAPTPNSTNNSGVTIDGGAISTTGSGVITVQGQLGTSSLNPGVLIKRGGVISGGTGGVSVTGVGESGVFMTDAHSTITSLGGDVAVTGTGSSGHGVYVTGGGTITGAGNILIQGTSRLVGKGGIGIVSAGTITSSGGDIHLIGASAAAASINVGGAIQSATGSIDLEGDYIQITNPLIKPIVTAAGGRVILHPRTSGIAINLGGDDSGTTLGLTADELGFITADRIQIGDANSGTITVTAPVAFHAATSLNLTCGGDIILQAGSVTSGGAAVTLTPGSGGAVKPLTKALDAGIGTAGLKFAPGTNLALAIDGTLVDFQYTQLNVAGAIDLTGVNLVLSGSFVPSGGQAYTIVANNGATPIVGTFNNLPEGTVFHNFRNSGLDAVISYVGGAGHDVVIYVGQGATASTVVTASTASITYGQSVTFAATVSTTGGTPTGNVLFYDGTSGLYFGGGLLVGTTPNSGTWRLVATRSQLPATGGVPHLIRAVYSPAATFFESAGLLSGGITIAPASLFVAGAIVNDKVYDGTTTGTINYGIAQLQFPFTTDEVFLDGASGTATFASKDVGAGIQVTVSGLALAGAQAQNYKLLPQQLKAANITQAPLTVSGITANSKYFDGTTTATLNTSNAALVGVVVGDSLTLNTSAATGTFASSSIGNNIAVTVAGLTISGPKTGDYTLTQPTTTANITPAPAVVSDGGTGILSIALGTGDALTVSSAGASYTFSLNAPFNAVSATSPANQGTAFSGLGTQTLTLTAAGMSQYTGINITDYGANASVTFTSTGTSVYSHNFTVKLANAAPGLIRFQGTSNFGASNLLAETTQSIFCGGSVTSTSGNITFKANQQTPQTGGNFIGIVINAGVTVQCTGSGVITLQGRGGATGSAGVVIGGRVSGGTGPISTVVSGTGGNASAGGAWGVQVDGDGAVVTSAGGDVQISGQGGSTTNASSVQNVGLAVTNRGIVTAGGSGNVTITGTGGSTVQGQNFGVYIAATVTSSGGNIQINATGGNGSASHGYYQNVGGQVMPGSTGSATITGTGGLTSGMGVYLGSKIQSNGGSILVTGTGKGGLAGINLNSVILTPTAGAPITLVSDAMQFDAGIINSGPKPVTLTPKSNGALINVGGADGTNTLGLTNAELAKVTAGTLQIGSASSGSLTVSAAITRSSATNMSLISGGDIIFGPGSINTHGGALLLTPGATGSVRPGASGTDAAPAPAALGFAAGANLSINVAGTTVDTQYSQLSVAGDVNLTGVNLVLSGSFTPTAGQTFTIVKNQGPNPILGTFNGLADGAVFPNFLGSGQNAALSYTGGDGNDAVLYVGNSARTTTQVTTSAPAATYGQPMSLTAAITAQVGVPTGNVEFFDDTTGADLGAGTFQSSSGSSAVWVLVTAPKQLKTLGGSAHNLRAAYTPGSGFFESYNSLTGGLVVAPASLTVSGVAANNKIHSHLIDATLSLGNAGLVGVVAGDVVSLNSSRYSAAFATKDVGTGIAVTVSGLALNGTDAANYTLIQPTLSANITPAPLTVTGITADKQYDSTTKAVLDISKASWLELYGGDDVTLDSTGATAVFASANAGIGIALTATGFSIRGAQAFDYTFSQPAITANIFPAPLGVTGIRADKVYDGTTSATLNTSAAALTGVLAGNSVSLDASGAVGTFSTSSAGQNVAITISGLKLQGPQAGNYTLPQAAHTSAGAEWSQYQGNAAHTGAVSDADAPPSVAPAWTVSAAALGAQSFIPSVTADATNVYLTASFGGATAPYNNFRVLELTQDSGAPVWSYGRTTYGTIASPPGILGDAIFVQFGGVGVGDGHAYDPYMVGLRAPTGAQVFATAYAAQTGYSNPPTVIGNAVFAQSGYYGGFGGYDAATGAKLWVNQAFTVSTPASNIPAADANRLYVGWDTLYALNKTTGNVDYSIRDVGGGPPPNAGNGYNVVLGSQNDALTVDQNNSQVQVVSFDLVRKTLRWHVPVNVTGTIAVADGKVYVPSGDRITILDEATGAQVGQMILGNGQSLTGNVLVTATTVFSSSATSTFAFDRNTLAWVWSANIGGVLAWMNHTLVVSNATTIQAFQAPPLHTIVTANITPAPITVAGITANNKPFDYTTKATLNTTNASLVGVFSGDQVTLDASKATASFASSAVGNNIPVTVSGLALAGPQAGNYTLIQPALTANITPPLPMASVNSISRLSGPKGLTPFSFQVKLSAGGSAKGPVTFDVFTADGTAKAGMNYVGISAGDAAHGGTVTFAKGSNVANVTVYVLAGSIPVTAGTKTFTVNLSDPLYPNVALSSGTGTIIPQYAPPPVMPGILLAAPANPSPAQPPSVVAVPAVTAGKKAVAAVDRVFAQSGPSEPADVPVGVLDQVFAVMN